MFHDLYDVTLPFTLIKNNKPREIRDTIEQLQDHSFVQSISSRFNLNTLSCFCPPSTWLWFNLRPIQPDYLVEWPIRKSGKREMLIINLLFTIFLSQTHTKVI